MFAQIEIRVLDRTKDAQTLDVTISSDGARAEASIMLRGQFELCDRQGSSMRASGYAALDAIRGALRGGDRILTESLRHIAHDDHTPLVVSIR